MVFMKKSGVVLLMLSAALILRHERPAMAQEQPQKPTLKFRVLAPDGQPLASEPLTMKFGGVISLMGESATDRNGVLNTGQEVKPGRCSIFLYSANAGYALLPNVVLQLGPDPDAPAMDVHLQMGGTLHISARELVALPGRRATERAVGGAAVSLNWIISERKGVGAQSAAEKQSLESWKWLDMASKSDAQGETWWFPFPVNPLSTRDDNGMCEVRNLPPGRYEVTLRSLPNYLSVVAPAYIAAGQETELPLYLASGAMAPLSLTVQNEAGEPLKHTELMLSLTRLEAQPLQSNWDLNESMSRFAMRTTRTDSKGECLIYPLRSGRWRIGVLYASGKQGLIGKDFDVEVPPQGTEATLELRPAPPQPAVPMQPAPEANPQANSWLNRSVPSNIRILSPSGAPLKSTRINFSLRGKNSSSSSGGGLTSDAGFIKVDGTNPYGNPGFDRGHYNVFVHVPGVGSAFARNVLMGADGVPVTDIRLQRGGTIRIVAHEKLWIAGGSRRSVDMPVGQASVQVRLLPSESEVQADPTAGSVRQSQDNGFTLGTVEFTRDGNGTGEFRSLPEGRYEVTVKSFREYAPVQEIVEVSEGRTTTVPVYLTRTSASSLRVLVQDETGAPLRDSDVIVMFSKASQAPQNSPGVLTPTIMTMGTDSSGMGRRIAHTDRRGECTIYPVVPGNWRIQASWMRKDNTYFQSDADTAVEVLPEGSQATFILKKPQGSYSIDPFWASAFRK
ncbi:MAG TPA: carboxypeptidase-like regulatory domain-containing protein [Abditibacteriaceae bacterium]